MKLSSQAQDWYYWSNSTGKIMRSPRTNFDNRIRGECSGITECCIQFFISTWRMDREANPEHDRLMGEARNLGFKFQYVPCPECLATRRFVEIRNCDGPQCFCGQWEHQQFVDYRLEAVEPEVRKAHKKWKRRIRMTRKDRRGYA